jgi:hypothetical protein
MAGMVKHDEIQILLHASIQRKLAIIDGKKG